MTFAKSPQFMRPIFKRAVVIPTILIGSHLIALPSLAQNGLLPINPDVIAGTVSISQPSPSALQIDQTTPNGIINWEGFSIGETNSVSFDNGSGATLNRVIGNNLSEINGALTATGSLYLINQNGVVFGDKGIVRTGQDFVVSTLNMADSDFLNGGDAVFAGDGAGFVLNLGEISSLGGDVALISKTVRNEGLIAAEHGTVGLIAGRDILMRDRSLDKGKFLVRLGGADTEIEEAGLIRAAAAELRTNGGNIYALAGNTTGSIQATGMAKSGGRIFLTAGKSGAVKLQKKLIAKSGRNGGKVLVTGGTIDASSLIDATGLDAGGLAVLYAEADTRFSGEILTFGNEQDGNAGFVEVSARQGLSFEGQVDTGGGTLLLDPQNVEILDFGGEQPTSLNDATSVFQPSVIAGALNQNNVVIHTSGEGEAAGTILVSSDIDYSSGQDLTLVAHGDIVLDASIRNADGAGGDVSLIAGWDGTTGGGTLDTPGLAEDNSFDASVFDSLELGTQTAFGNSNGVSYTIDNLITPASGSVLMFGDTSFVATEVGSRSGTTRVYANNINLRSNTTIGDGFITPDFAPSQIGFTPGSEQSGVTISGDILVGAVGSIFLNASGDDSYAQIGHIGATSDANATGDIVVNAGSNIALNPGRLDAYAMIGHGSLPPEFGSQIGGLRQGDVTIRSSSLNLRTGVPIIVDEGGGTVSAQSWLGHLTTDQSTFSNSDFVLETGTLNASDDGSPALLPADIINNAWQAGDVTVAIDESVLLLNDLLGDVSSDLIDSPIDSEFINNLTIQSVDGDITIGAGAVILTDGTSDITLAASEGTVINNSGLDAAIVAENARIAIFSNAPDASANQTDIASIDDVEFGVTFADGAASSGNVLAYQVAPDLTFTASDQSRTYATGLNNSLITLEILEGESTADQADYDFVLGGITTQLGFGSGVTFSTADAANVGTYEGGVAVSATLDEGAATGMNITTVDGELTINPLSLFIESVGPFDKVYDGTTDASTSMFEFAEGSGLVRNDVVNFSITGDYGDKNVGSEKTVTDISVALSGMDAGNYEAFTLSESEGEIEGIGSISARALALNVGVDDKVYDGGTVAAVNFSDDRVTGDALTFSASGAFEDKDVGTNKTVLVGEITVGGADAGNYAIDTTLDTTADISRRVLSLELTAEDRAYDGTTIAKVSTTDDRIEGDVLSFGGSPVFEDKNVGEDKFVTLEGASLSGVDAANYQLSDDIGTTAAITARGLSVTGSPDDKVYDGTDTVDVSFSDDRVEGDVLTVVASASFADKNVGTDKEIEVFGISISGTDAGNYVVEGSAGGTADITARDLNVTAGAADKEYDGTTVADITFADDGIEGDTLSLSGTAVFDTKSAGLGKSVSISDVALIGDDASNYTLVVNDAASADISRLTLSLETIASDKIYDGNTVAEVSFEATPLEGDDVTVNGTGAFDDKNVGDEKTVTVSDGILSGDDAENYTLGEDITDVASITPRALNIFVEVADKAYDGTTDASVSLDDDRVAGDVLTVTGIAAFDDKNVGVDKPVNIFEFDVSGADVGNYEASIETVEVATITPRELTLMVDAEDKIYDGTTDAIANIFVDEIEGDAVTAVGIGKFDTKNAGTDKTVTVTEVALSGSDAANYSAATSAQGIADIDPRLLSLTVTAQDRIFDGTTDIELDVSDDRVDGDDITVTATGSLADGDPGQDKAVTVTSFAVTGPDAGNYQAIAPNNQTQASIAPAETRESARPQPQINERAPEPVPTPSLVEAGFGVYSDVATDALVRDLNAASEFCRQIGESEYVVDCLGDRLAEIARRLPANGAYAESREALETAAQKLEALVRENASAALPPLRIATRSLSGGGTQNRVLRAIDTANIASVTEQAVAILQEAETVLLRSAESSQRRRVHYQRIATAVGSNKLLLRST